LDICNDTSLESGADFAKFDRYFKEKVRETDFSRIMETPGSEESSVVLDFLEVWVLARSRAAELRVNERESWVGCTVVRLARMDEGRKIGG
jgi:hypothetical protein